jgi:hypothetical protein
MVPNWFGFCRTEEEAFFPEWQQELPALSTTEKAALSVWTALPQTLAYLVANPNPH